MIERVADPLDPQEWDPRTGAVRFSFETGRLMQRAGIPQDMSHEADDRYLELLKPLAEDIGSSARVRATGYRYGPAAGGEDFAFMDLVVTGVALSQAAAAIIKTIKWLRVSGALETRISQEGAETLARWELERRGLPPDSTLLSVALSPGTGTTPWGDLRRHGGYVLVFRLADGRLATLTFALDGILENLSLSALEDASSGPLPERDSVNESDG